MMSVDINGISWEIVFVLPNDPRLLLNGVHTLGVTDIYDNTVYIAGNLSNEVLYDVLVHELTHAWIASYGYDVSISCDEIISQIVERESDLIQDLADYVYENM